jgi:uncharacterized protein (TIGR02145 family)
MKFWTFILLLFFSFNFFTQENCESARLKYLQDNPDVKNAKMDPWVHYTTFGQKEGRKWSECSINQNQKIENCESSRLKYLQENPDVKNAKMDPWVHYTIHGQKEGRKWPLCTSNNPSSQNNNKVEYMYCSSGNCEDGYGTMIFPEKSGLREYTGTWKKRYRDSRLDFVECKTLDCKFEKGKLIYSDGSYYEGCFDPGGSGLYQGLGYFQHSNGSYEKGDFFKGELNGIGEEKKKDGIIYKGQFVNGLRQGICTMIYPNGDVVKGRYWDGKFVSEKDDISTAKLDTSIVTSNPTDIKNYSTISINGKEWMKENLNVSKFRNGDQITHAKTEKELLDANSNQLPVWCYYDFNQATETYYGKLYNWYAINDPRGVLPLGFTIPSNNDWLSLNNFEFFKNTAGRAHLYLSEGKDVGTGKINKRYFFQFENGPSKVIKYDKIFGTKEPQLGFYWTTSKFQDQYNDLIGVFIIGSDSKIQKDNYLMKGTCVSVRAIKGDDNHYEGGWIGNLKSGFGIEYYGVKTEIKGYGIAYKGDRYEGYWKNGEQHGEGTLFQSNGLKVTGLWKNGGFIGEWRMIDNRHKCYQCNSNLAKFTLRSEKEISMDKIGVNSNEINLYNTQLYCSNTCETKASIDRKSSEVRLEKERNEKEILDRKNVNITLYDNSGYTSNSHILGYFQNETVFDASGYKSSSHILAFCKNGAIYDNSGYTSTNHIIGFYKDGTIYDNTGYTSPAHIRGYFNNGTLYDNSGYRSSTHILGYYSGGDESGAAAIAFILLF